jgi:hypothetical protein
MVYKKISFVFFVIGLLEGVAVLDPSLGLTGSAAMPRDQRGLGAGPGYPRMRMAPELHADPKDLSVRMVDPPTCHSPDGILWVLSYKTNINLSFGLCTVCPFYISS